MESVVMAAASYEPQQGLRGWLDTDREGAEGSVVGEQCQMLVGTFPECLATTFLVVRVDRLRNRVLLEVP